MYQAKIIYNYRGKEYPLMMDLYALEQIEDEFGGMRELRSEMTKGKQFHCARSLFRILGNAALEDQDLPETLTGKEIRRATLAEITELMSVILRLLDIAGITETGAGEAASDEKKELFEDEEDEKNG